MQRNLFAFARSVVEGVAFRAEVLAEADRSRLTASLPNLNRMRHQGFHKSINSLLFATENRQFHNFIIIIMILLFPHNSAFRWEEVLAVITFRRFPCTMIYAPW